MASDQKTKNTDRQWVRPEVRKIEAGSAENGTTGINDGGPVGAARS